MFTYNVNILQGIERKRFDFLLKNNCDRLMYHIRRYERLCYN